MRRVIGMDIHRTFAEVVFWKDGRLRWHGRVDMTRSGLEGFGRSLVKDDEVVLEATGNTMAVVRTLRPYVARVIIANPLQVKAIAHAHIKTDKIDAGVLASLHAAGFLPEVWLPDAETERRRRLVARRNQIVRHRTRVKNETHAILAPPLAPPCPHAELFNRPGRAWLAHQVLPDDERAAITRHLRELDRLGEDLAVLDREIAEATVDDPAVRRLLTIAGVNLTVAAGLVAAIRALLAASPFHGEGHRKIWARLRFAGIRTSKRRVLRLMREHGLLAPARVGRPHGPRGPRRHDPNRAGRRDVGHRSDLDPDRRGAGFDLRHGRSLLDRMRRHPRRPPGDSLRGARATAPRGACLLRRFRRGRRRRPRAPPRPRQSVRRRRLPTRAGLPRHQQLTRLRARARGQRLRRALHPHAEGEPAVGPPLRHHRGATPGAPRIPGHLQPDLDRRTPRLPDPSGRQSGAACAAPGSRMKLQCGVSQLWTATTAGSPAAVSSQAMTIPWLIPGRRSRYRILAASRDINPPDCAPPESANSSTSQKQAAPER